MVTTPLSLRGGAGGEALFAFLRFAEGLGVRLRSAGVSAYFPLFHLQFHHNGVVIRDVSACFSKPIAVCKDAIVLDVKVI